MSKPIFNNNGFKPIELGGNCPISCKSVIFHLFKTLTLNSLNSEEISVTGSK
jgi:hypothetical protein